MKEAYAEAFSEMITKIANREITSLEEADFNKLVHQKMAEKRLSYTYRIVSFEGNKMTLQAIENAQYKIDIVINSMSCHEENN